MGLLLPLAPPPTLPSHPHSGREPPGPAVPAYRDSSPPKHVRACRDARLAEPVALLPDQGFRLAQPGIAANAPALGASDLGGVARNRGGWFLPETKINRNDKNEKRNGTNYETKLLRGIIVNRAYVTHKNLYIQAFLLTIFGPINYGPPVT